MKCGQLGYRSFAVGTALTILVGGLARLARADRPAYDLFIQGSPVQAGEVTPNTGSHRIYANSSVTLTAVPQAGYRFAYWLGDVSDPSAQRTTIVVNESKIVIAVFQIEPARRIDDQIARSGAGGGFDTLAGTATDLHTPAWTSAGGAAKGESRTISTIVPVVIPEPATIALLGLGILALRRHRR